MKIYFIFGKKLILELGEIEKAENFETKYFFHSTLVSEKDKELSFTSYTSSTLEGSRL